MKRTVISLGWLLALAACGASQLEPRFVPPATLSEATVAANISRAEPRQERPVAVGISLEPAQLCAWDLSTGKLWELPIQAIRAPLVVGSAVVVQEESGVVVRDLDSGAVRTRLDIDGELVGADGIGDALIVSIAQRGEKPGGTLAFIVGNDVRWSKTFAQPVGVPALVQDQILAPWGTQRLSVLAALDGTELARWDFQKFVLAQALVDQGHVYIGQHGLMRVGADLPERRYGARALYAPEKRPVPGQPGLLRDGYAALPGLDSAEHKVRLAWRPSAASAGGIEDELAVFAFYRLVFGLSAEKDQVRWVRKLAHDVVGAFKQPGGVFVADAHGGVRFLDTTGATRFMRAFDKPLRVVTLRPGSFLAAGDASAKLLQPSPLETPESSLHDQLLSAAKLEDDRLAPGRAMAIKYLARSDAGSVTKELIALCRTQAGQGSSNELARRAACDELAQRETGASDVLEALRSRASLLEQTERPPVGALAQAAVNMGLNEAGPLLISHLESPHTPAPDLVQIFLALQSLHYRPAVPQLERFLRLHHAEPQGSELAQALQAALLALGALQGTKVRDTVNDISNDVLTLAAVRQTAKEVLIALDTPAPAKPAEVARDRKAHAKAVVKDVFVGELILTDPRPYALDRANAEKAFRPLHAGLMRCLTRDRAGPKSARISMIVSGEGKVEGFLATPTTIQSCVEPILRNAQFPPTRLGRQHLVHTIEEE